MNNTTLLLVLAVGGIAVWAMTRTPEPSRPVIIQQKAPELSDAQKTVGAFETLYDQGKSFIASI